MREGEGVDKEDGGESSPVNAYQYKITVSSGLCAVS